MTTRFVCLALALLAPASFAQTAAFDVASVRQNLSDHSGDRNSHFSVSASDEGIKLAVQNASLLSLIQRAYSLKEFQISGPEWLRNAFFDITATLPAGTARDQLMPALQALLAERFQMAVHRQQKDLPVYALVVAKNGPKLNPPAEPDGKNGTWDSKGKFTAKNVTLAQFGEVLSRHLDRPVIDTTGLSGAFDFELAYGPEQSHSNDDDGPSIFAALQDKLGLKLESRKAPVDLLVIDKVEKTPTQ
jgi:uncharacterized protein (TIGR03435 family)